MAERQTEGRDSPAKPGHLAALSQPRYTHTISTMQVESGSGYVTHKPADGGIYGVGHTRDDQAEQPGEWGEPGPGVS